MSRPLHHAVGVHLLGDLGGIAPEKLVDPAAIEALLRDSALACGATILHSHFHSFGPGQGVTGVVLLAESHISIHTWPELGFAAVDIFMCGEANPLRALDLIQSALAAQRCVLQTIERGGAHPGKAP
ncbi:MAG: adenosylmethionine decarboxylase [Herminiimonas sp.]|nr:adenosylmethionine decarboxylase [Herminiimonas sp.]